MIYLKKLSNINENSGDIRQQLTILSYILTFCGETDIM